MVSLMRSPSDCTLEWARRRRRQRRQHRQRRERERDKKARRRRRWKKRLDFEPRSLLRRRKNLTLRRHDFETTRHLLLSSFGDKRRRRDI